MNVSARRGFSLIKDLAYVRTSGSPEEKRGAQRILEEVQSFGVKAWLEPFPVALGKVNHAKLVVTAPYVKEYEVTGYERSNSTPEGGLDANFYYAENLQAAHLPHCKGKVVLINDRLRLPVYEQLQKAGAAVILTYSGTTLDKRSETDCDVRTLRESLTESFGDGIAMNIRAADAQEIVRRGATRMHIELDSQRYTGESYNVCAVIEGEKYPDEIISLGAHHDSTPYSQGVFDDLSGCALIMELCRYFAVHKPARTLKFNWFGSEETGLVGSKAWVRQHADELDKHLLMLNFDAVAAILGNNVAPILGTPDAVGYVDGVMREIGFPCAVTLDIWSSDCIPFADKGIPCVNLCRPGATGAMYIHDRRDCLKSSHISAEALDITLQQALYFTRRVANADVFPIPRKICPEIVNKVDAYLFKKKA